MVLTGLVKFMHLGIIANGVVQSQQSWNVFFNKNAIFLIV